MGFSSIKDYVDSEESGKHTISVFRKNSSVSIGSVGIWLDFSTYAGNPKANYYASNPLESDTLNGNFGIYHGQDAPTSKFLKRLTIPVAHGTGANHLTLCDYLLYYPFIDGDETSPQPMENTVSLPRYTNGEGVRAVMVSQSPYIGGQSYFITYTNSDGVSGRISPTITSQGNATLAGSLPIAQTQSDCFLPLQAGDKGIRSIESITINAPIGGLHALVLVKPLARIGELGITSPVEKDFLTDHGTMPEIKNGAFLGFFAYHSTNPGANAAIFGSIETVWGDN